jgi:hypothetical protein
MFTYSARLHKRHALPAYPIALFSNDRPQRTETDEYRVQFPDLEVLAFRFRVVQLNQIAGLSVEQLDALAEAQLDFGSSADLTAWLEPAEEL